MTHLPLLDAAAASRGWPWMPDFIVNDYATPATKSGRTCQSCGVALVERENPTALAAELGTWFDHPPVPGGDTFGHTSSALDPSPALRAHLAEQEAAARQDTLPLGS